jgi:hypothetical protein
MCVVLGAAEARGAQLTLSWIDNSSGTAAFSIERRPASSATFTPLATVAQGNTTFVDASLTQGASYCYRVRAYEGVATSPYSNEACGSTPYTVTVTLAGNGAGTVVSTPSGITCGSACAAAFLPGTPITLTAIPKSGSAFAGWSGNGCVGTAACVLAGNVPVSVTATFCRSLNHACGTK